MNKLAEMKNFKERTLNRRLNLLLLTLYGIGNILGAGIYVLIGKISGHAGMFVPISFIIALTVAGFMAVTYSKISSRFPESAGEAKYISEGFNLKWLSILVGCFIAVSGIISASVMITGVVGYVQIFFDFNYYLIIIAIVIIFGLVANIGVREAIGTAAFFTLIESAGLAYIIYVASPSLMDFPARFSEFIPVKLEYWPGIFSGAFLAFYAFVGFEDMVNMADEVYEPEKNLAKSILISMIIVTVFYILVSLVTVLSISPEMLSASDAPLALVYETSTGRKPIFISIVSIFAVLNGGLIQIIMASRILYGMSRRGWLPDWISYVHGPTGSPLASSGIVIAFVMLFSLILPVDTLARITSFFLLFVFSLVSLSLIRIIKKDAVTKSVKIKKMEVGIPWISFFLTAGLIVLELLEIFKTAQ